MENSAQKAGFAIGAMIIVIVVAGVGADWWDAYHIRKAANAGALNDPGTGDSTEELKKEIEKLKVDNMLLNIQIDDLRKQLQAAEKKELKPLEKEPEALKPETAPVKTVPPGDGPISEN